jgi:hypothetical protein
MPLSPHPNRGRLRPPTGDATPAYRSGDGKRRRAAHGFLATDHVVDALRHVPGGVAVNARVYELLPIGRKTALQDVHPVGAAPTMGLTLQRPDPPRVVPSPRPQVREGRIVGHKR